MITKSENPSFETIVREALEKMSEATSAPASYEVDRSSGHWTVRRASKTNEQRERCEYVPSRSVAPSLI